MACASDKASGAEPGLAPAASGPRVRRALISVSDKAGVVDFARGLVSLGIEIVSTGGTAALLRTEGIPVRLVEEVTGYPEMLDGRVRTLHPKIHGGILADRENAAHTATLAEHAIQSIDLVVVSFYPFERALREDLSEKDAKELIDIGGPCLLRAAAKNAWQVAPVVSPSRYAPILDELRGSGGYLGRETRQSLRREVFAATAAYDAAISAYLTRDTAGAVPDVLALVLAGGAELRYGENPHQSARLFPHAGAESGTPYRVLGGKTLSFNNIVDLDAAARTVHGVALPCAAIVKHTNPCGAATAGRAAEAFRRALAADTVSAFGGIVALNRQVDAETAAAVSEIFVEAVIAPAFSEDALTTLGAKKNLRLVEMPTLADARTILPPALEMKPTLFGVLVQSADVPDRDAEWRLVAGGDPSAELLSDARFAWHVAQYVKSNAIVLVKDGRTIGVGAGQMNRVDSVRIALENARRFGFDPAGSALASDAFFPFPDGAAEACGGGVRLIIQPGGSLRDDAVIEAVARSGASMMFTGRRHFKH
ncbi:MAG: bifunctional phosphoribosylaminoimidazolecarboxamide formyltransferase/IMP cyclohydrolase [bacterium]